MGKKGSVVECTSQNFLTFTQSNLKNTDVPTAIQERRRLHGKERTTQHDVMLTQMQGSRIKGYEHDDR